jgi:hypothetical protein
MNESKFVFVGSGKTGFTLAACLPHHRFSILRIDTNQDLKKNRIIWSENHNSKSTKYLNIGKSNG